MWDNKNPQSVLDPYLSDCTPFKVCWAGPTEATLPHHLDFSKDRLRLGLGDPWGQSSAGLILAVSHQRVFLLQGLVSETGVVKERKQQFQGHIPTRHCTEDIIAGYFPNLVSPGLKQI